MGIRSIEGEGKENCRKFPIEFDKVLMDVLVVDSEVSKVTAETGLRRS